MIIPLFASLITISGWQADKSFATDLVILGATVYQAPTQAQAGVAPTAIVISKGVIQFIGTDEEAEQYITDSTEVIDASDLFVMPGFVDTHNHVFEGASEVGGNCELAPNETLEGQIPHLETCAEAVQKAGDWIIGYGHQFEVLMNDDPKTNPLELLDELFPENPVILMEETSHSMLANSQALSLAGYLDDPVNPQGGTIMLSPVTERPNGVVFDNAGDRIMELAWNSLENNFDVSYDGLVAGMEESVKHGITTIGDGRLYWRRGWFDVWQEAERKNDLLVRVSVRPWIYPDVKIDEQLSWLKEAYSNDTSRLLLVNQVKMYIDGILHFGTAKLLEPYLQTWQTDLPYGLNYIPADVMPELLIQLDSIGYGAHIHAIGDAGVKETLNAIEYARQKNSKQLYSMTHLEMIQPEDYPRFQSLSVFADYQAGAKIFGKGDWAGHYIGEERSHLLTPMRALYDQGATVTFSSDWTVNDINPLVAIANSVRLQAAKGLPSIHEAIQASTLNGAKSLGLESITGSIDVGKSADLVILDTDISKASWQEIESAGVVSTWLQGEAVYDNDDKQ